MSVRDERFEALLGPAAPLVAAVFDALPDAIGVVWQIVDETGALVDFEVGYTNPGESGRWASASVTRPARGRGANAVADDQRAIAMRDGPRCVELARAPNPRRALVVDRRRPRGHTERA